MSSQRCAAVLTVALFESVIAFGHPLGSKVNFADTVFLPAGMVAESGGRIGFVPNANPERIDAVDLQTGKVLWKTTAAYRPLLAGRDRLVALARVKDKRHTLRVVVLDTSAREKGKRLLASDPVVFAPGETGGWFLKAAPEVVLYKGDLLLKWHIKHTAGPGIRGGRPTSGGTIVCKESLRINLKTGQVKKLPEKDWPAPRIPRAAERVKGRHDYMFRGSRREDVFAVGKVAVVFADTPKGKPGLRRWDLASGKEYAPVVLAQEHPCFLHVTSDQRHVLAHIGLPEEDLAKKGLDTAMRIFALETGERVGKFPYETRALDFGVRGTVLYYYVAGEPQRAFTPRYLKAYDLKTGKSLWTLRLRDKRNGEWWN
jgi:hypothetical protein